MMQTIRQGDTGGAVTVAQCLTDYEITDGVFTSFFFSHVKNWQQRNKLTTDGIVGAKTWKKIAEEAPLVSVKHLRYGQYAKAVQVLVGAEPDGIFGSKTQEAVKAYQKEHGLAADGIVGTKTWMMFITGQSVVPVVTPGEKPVDYKQYDKRWGNEPYTITGNKKQTISSSGCGPTSMADIIATWWDKDITPLDVAKDALKWGYRTKGSGTTSGLFKKCAMLYKARDYRQRSSIDDVIKCLADGGLVIVCFGTGTKGKAGYQKWTKGGHYCVIWKWDGEKFHINDPASSSASRAVGTREEIINTRKGFYLFWR